MGEAKASTMVIKHKMCSCSALSGASFQKLQILTLHPLKFWCSRFVCILQGSPGTMEDLPDLGNADLQHSPSGFWIPSTTFCLWWSCLWLNIWRHLLASTSLWDHFLLQMLTPPGILNAHLKPICSMLWSPFYVNKQLLGSMLKTAP